MTSPDHESKKLILASASTYRRDLLARLKLDFAVQAADIDESVPFDETAHHAVLRLAEMKARTVAEKNPGAVVIGSDQIALLGEKIIGKPNTREQAKQQLRQSSGRSVDFLTAVTVIDGEKVEQDIDTTRIKFRDLDDDAIDRYLDADEPYDCAGAIRSEGLGITLLAAVDTRDPSALIGLPLIALTRMLREAGFAIP
ncbi:Maf family nucleotide pyrophosphatase [Halorhodospira halochloris]|uniref:7-methyl-GTP pyrophosphatase n=1 Tax=Halorhodospira halochloris TaxID=1052 RepID=A0A120MZW4_HALHR|nr:Maf family protein [Halorhodospira halochloris]MBK1652091.1 septum formation protein Maf [Halorhodospira halochloris]MCG5530773.1 Maf family nucleotide pyrophosphatase [Halorhodospira halochloris]MCG5549039.1 Maf family nucleotide pyrophosphatase [Halorhodospira halochloris]BAU58013.1 septum formation protein Maf [Halorhodospira halochloris]